MLPPDIVSQSLQACRNASGLDIVVGYLPGMGLCNQLYQTYWALAITVALSATLQLQNAWYRDSYGKDAFQLTWAAAPIDLLLDVDAMAKHWEVRGLGIVRSAEVSLALEQPNDAATASVLLPSEGELDPGGVPTGLGTADPSKAFDHSLLGWTTTVRKAALDLASAADPQHMRYRVNLNRLYDAVDPRSSPGIFAAAFRSLRYAPRLVALADAAVDKLRQRHGGAFAGIHLRIEEDYVAAYGVPWYQCHTPFECMEKLVMPALARAQLNRSLPLYSCSGLYSADPEAGARANELLQQHASVVYTKDDLLAASDLRDLNLEQQALVDLMVLTTSDVYFGIGWHSTFSTWVGQARVLEGRDPSTNHFITGCDKGIRCTFVDAPTPQSQIPL